MTDLEMTKLCAEAMGREFVVVEGAPPKGQPWWAIELQDETLDDGSTAKDYNPLTDDAQAMALVKRFELEIGWYITGLASVNFPNPDGPNWIAAKTLNRAIVTCVAQMQTALAPDDAPGT